MNLRLLQSKKILQAENIRKDQAADKLAEVRQSALNLLLYLAVNDVSLQSVTEEIFQAYFIAYKTMIEDL